MLRGGFPTLVPNLPDHVGNSHVANLGQGKVLTYRDFGQVQLGVFGPLGGGSDT